MRIHRYFRRSTTRIRTSPTSFSSRSSSSSFHETSDGNTTKANPFEDSKHKKPSLWKQRSFRAKSRTRKQSETKQTANKTKESNCSENEDFQNAAANEEPSELERAFEYFEIINREDFNRMLIKKKYKKLCLIHHPDRNGNDEQSKQEMQMINHYFEVLQEELDGEAGNHETENTSSNSSDDNDNEETADHTKANRNETKQHRRSTHKAKQNSFRRSKQEQESCQKSNSRFPRGKQRTGDWDPLGNLLLDIGLSFLVGRFVIQTGWLTSMVLIALAHFAQEKPARLSKSHFFALSTGWYLLLQILFKIHIFLGELPWQLWGLGLATILSSYLDNKKTLGVANVIVDGESALIAFFDYILSKNIRYESNNIPMQTIADFVVLSIGFFAIKLICDAM